MSKRMRWWCVSHDWRQKEKDTREDDKDLVKFIRSLFFLSCVVLLRVSFWSFFHCVSSHTRTGMTMINGVTITISWNVTSCLFLSLLLPLSLFFAAFYFLLPFSCPLTLPSFVSFFFRLSDVILWILSRKDKMKIQEEMNGVYISWDQEMRMNEGKEAKV